MELYMENIVSTKTLVENVESGTIFSANFFLYGEHTLRGKKDPLSYTNRHMVYRQFHTKFEIIFEVSHKL